MTLDQLTERIIFEMSEPPTSMIRAGSRFSVKTNPAVHRINQCENIKRLIQDFVRTEIINKV